MTIEKKSTAEYENEEDTTFFYLIIYKKDDDSKIRLSFDFSNRESAVNSPTYKEAKYKRIVRIEAKENWLKKGD